MQVPEVQVLEPALFKDEGENYRGLYESTYATLSGGVPLNLVTFYDDLGANYEWVVQLPVEAVSIDFCGVVRLPLHLRRLRHARDLCCRCVAERVAHRACNPMQLS